MIARGKINQTKYIASIYIQNKIYIGITIQKACSLLVSSCDVTPGRNSRGDLIKEIINMATPQLTSLLDPLLTPHDLSPQLNHFTSLMFLLNMTLRLDFVYQG